MNLITIILRVTLQWMIVIQYTNDFTQLKFDSQCTTYYCPIILKFRWTRNLVNPRDGSVSSRSGPRNERNNKEFWVLKKWIRKKQCNKTFYFSHKRMKFLASLNPQDEARGSSGTGLWIYSEFHYEISLSSRVIDSLKRTFSIVNSLYL